MRRRYFSFLLLIFTAFQWVHQPVLAQNKLEQQAQNFFSVAEKNFLADEPTEETDKVAIDHYQKVVELFENAGQNGLLLAESYQRLASIDLGMGNFDEAKKGYHQALSLKKSLTQMQDSVYFQELIYLGDAHFLTDRPDSAEWYYIQAQHIATAYPEIYDIERLFNSFGAFFYQTGNYIQAINYYQKALSLLDKDNVDYDEALVSFTYNIANAQLKMSRYMEAIHSYKKLLSYGIFSEYIYLNLGLAFIQTDQYDSAQHYLDKTISSPNPRVRLSSTNALGHLKLRQGEPIAAAQHFQNAIDKNKSLYQHQNALLTKSFLGLGDVLMEQENYQEAQLQYQRAIENNALIAQDSSRKITQEYFSQIISPLDLFSALKGKGEALRQYFLQDRNERSLRRALDAFQEAIKTAQYIQRTYDNDEAKLFLVQKVYPLYETAIATANHLFKLTDDLNFAHRAFEFSENSKAAVLSEVLDKLKIKATAQLSDSLIFEERRWKQKITKARLRMVESQDSSTTDVLRQQLIDYEIGLARTVKALERDEKYYQLKYQSDRVDISSLQQDLIDRKDALLEYFMGTDSLYGFLVTQSSFEVKSFAINDELASAMEEVRTSVYNYRVGDKYNQAKNAYVLYQYLIQPFEAVLSGKKRLIIVPDGPLSYIPLEMLNNNPQTNHYLIYDYTFSYAYSASLLNEAINQRRVEESGSILAMAPFAGDEEGNIRSNGFSMLFSSKEEVENIGGSIYLEDKATKRLFLELAGSYGILHLATHASISSDDPLDSFIAFYPDQDSTDVGYRLYTHELYNLELDSVKLVVLSACEAGNGKLVKGEGIISLARAFAYAGCPNIITTLWKALDKSTASIATGVHQYLKEGYTKDEALRQAKLDYLKAESVHPLMKTPYHWANFIFIGDPDPIYDTYSPLWWWLLGVLAVVILVYLLFKKRMIRIQ